MAKETKIGKVSHFYSKLSVGIVKLSAPLKVGEQIHIKGHTSDFNQPIESMEVEHQKVEEAKKGEVIGVKVSDHVREGDEVFKVTDSE